MKPQGLGRRAARGIKVTGGGQIVAILTQLLSVVVLSRLLSPDEYGLLAMVMAIVVVGEVIREFGLANAAIQAPVLTNQQRSNLFWWNAGLGATCAIALYLSAPLIATFYDEPRVEPIAEVLAVTFLLGGLATQSKAHLARDMRFGVLTITDVAPGVLGLVAGVGAALLGWGVWALVAQRVVIALLVLILAVSFDRWLPRLPRRTDGMAPLLRYGLNLVGTQLISGASRNIDYIVLGHRFGASATGLYSRAFELVINTLNQINAPATKVAVPVLARLQDDRRKFDAFLLRGQRALLLAIIPLCGLGVALAEPLVAVALGPDWAEVVPYIQALAVVAATDRILGYATWWFALATGRTDVTLRVTLVRAVLLVAGVLVGSNFGALGVAWGLAVATTVGWLADLGIYRWLAGAPSGRLLKNSLVAIAMNVGPVLATLVLGSALASLGSVGNLLLGIVVYGAVWLALAFVLPPFRSHVQDVLRLIGRARGR